MSHATSAPGGATSEELRHLLRHREVGATLLSGHGLEIGALHYPLVVPGAEAVEYLDVEDAAMLRRRFPELSPNSIVEPRWVGDVVRASVRSISGRRFDFIVMNHVLEHVPNPIQVLANVWDGLVDGGHLVLSVPDKHFIFDRARPLTSFEHVLAEFFRGATTVEPAHYVEFLETTRPEVFGDRRRFLAALEEVTARREHAHVWDSASFRRFWERTATLLGFEARSVYESAATVNRFEYFLVVQRSLHAGVREDEALRVLAAVYRARGDLQDAFPASDPDLVPRLLGWATTAGATIDSDAAALGAFREDYRRLLERIPREGNRLEERLRASLGG